MTTYWVSYNILDGQGGPLVGQGGMERQMQPPGSANEVADLSSEITSEQHRSGYLSRACWLSVIAWSELG